MSSNYDFGGWATKNNIRCTDGRVIRPNSFKHNDGKRVPLVWNHQHGGPENILGHAILQHRDEGVYAYGYFNESEKAQAAKEALKHGDIFGLSIWANQLREEGRDVMHGDIKELSLVLAGANPGANIETVIAHSEDYDGVAIIKYVEDEPLVHADAEESTASSGNTGNSERTVGDVIDSMNDEQRMVLEGMCAESYEEGAKSASNNIKHSDEGASDEMKYNVFDQTNEPQQNTLSHADMEIIFKDAKRIGSLKEAFLQHAAADPEANPSVTFSPNYNSMPQGSYGIDGIDWLFPEARALSNQPEFLRRDTEWVAKFMRGVHKTPFSRIKSIFADITAEEARARGYTKGKKKVEEVFTLLKRATTPQTIYKKQKMDRDDIIDITDFDIVAYLKGEMRGMLDEEIARAALIGDGRASHLDDKISEDHIRPIYTDDELFSIHKTIDTTGMTTDDEKSRAYIRGIIKSRKDYKGSGNPTFWTTEDVLTDMLLIEDKNGRIIYDTMEKLKTALRVNDIVTVPVMEGVSRQSDGDTLNLIGIIVNLNDYNIGADKGGAVSMFDDFDIDFNQYKYLIETRCSGALIKPFSAIVIESK